jgi:hypothetical protein
MKASPSTSPASSSRATPSPATKSSAASCCSTKAQVYNSQLWEYSLLRLNQLEYFDPSRSIRTPKPIRMRSGHRRPAAQGQGKGQELHRPQRRRQRPLRRVPGRQLPDQQLPRSGRNAQRAGQPGQRQPPVPLRLLAALPSQPAPQPGLPALQQQAGLQRRQELPDHRLVGQPQRRAAVSDPELQPGLDRPEFSSAIRSSATPSSASA